MKGKERYDELLWVTNVTTSILRNNNHSPVFSTDLVKTSKTRKGEHHNKFTKRRSVNFNLYLDGIHPGHLLSKVWLEKITQATKK